MKATPTRDRSKIQPIPLAPGKILKEQFLKPMGISVAALAAAVQCNPRQIYRIISGEQVITSRMAENLARTLGTEKNFWSTAQFNNEIAELRRMGRLK